MNPQILVLQITSEEGTLVVRPLTIEWLTRTAELLTDVFAILGGPAFQTYRRYMRNQIRTFLEVQIWRFYHTNMGVIILIS